MIKVMAPTSDPEPLGGLRSNSITPFSSVTKLPKVFVGWWLNHVLGWFGQVFGQMLLKLDS